MNVAMIGPGDADDMLQQLAEQVGEHIGGVGMTVICGGLGGVMAAACRGAKRAGSTTVGLLPGTERSDANAWVDIPLATGLGEARNALVVANADVVIAIGGGHGTLSEIALALRAGTPVIGLGTWDIPGVVSAVDPREVARLVRRSV